MNSKSSDKCAVLKDQSGNPVPLTGIDVRATIDDVLTRACITQTYENREEQNIEAVYTFPLMLDAVLLDFTVRIDGKVRRGTVMKKVPPGLITRMRWSRGILPPCLRIPVTAYTA